MSPEYSPQHEKRERDWRLADTVVALAVAALLAYGVAGSYESLSHLALAHHLPLPRLFPAGLDGGLIGTIALDIRLTWRMRPVGWLRQVARLFALGTVAANFTAGWPDWVSAGLRVAAPVLIVVIAEAIRTVLLRKMREAEGDPIPRARWILAPWPTWKLYRRMKLWEMTSYRAAVSMELERLNAVHKLSAKFGEDWRRVVPGNLGWMLSDGVRMGEALTLVEELCAPAPALPPATAGAPGRRQAPARRAASRKRQGRDIDTQAQALALYLADGEISGSELGRRLGLSPSRGRAILAELKQSAPHTGPLERVRMGD